MFKERCDCVELQFKQISEIKLTPPKRKEKSKKKKKKRKKERSVF